MALVVTIATVDRTSVVEEDTIKINQLADSHTFTAELTIFDVDGDISITAGSHLVAKEITIVDGATTFFGGYIASKDTISAEDGSRHIKLLCCGYAILLQETLIEYEEYISTGDPDISDEDVIDDLFANYLATIDVVDHVVELDPSISILFNKMNLAEIMTAICQRTGGRWYVDNEKKLHYFDVETNEAGFDLSDTPNDVTSFGYYIKPMRRDNGTAITNEVMVVGADDWVDTVNDANSQTLYGVRGAIVADHTRTTIAELQERGNVVLANNKDPKIKFVVTTPHGGADAGDEIDFKSVILNYDSLNGDDKLIIREMSIYWEQSKPVYEMTLGEAETSSISRATFIDSKLRDLEINPNIPTASRGWVHDLVFSATDEDTVAWASGSIVMDDGTLYSIDADNTGAMGDVTYIYFSKDDSLTVLYTDETFTDAVGRAKILVAVAKPRAAGLHATYLVFGGEGHNALVDTENIVDLAIETAKLATDAVETVKIKDLNVTTAKILITSGDWLGLAVDKGRIVFTDAATDTIAFLTCNMGVNVAPLYPLHVKGWGNTYTTTSFVIEDSDGAVLWFMRDDGYTGFKTTLPGARMTINGNLAVGYVNIVAPAAGAIISGRTGVGTSGPNSKLEVQGEGTGFGTYAFRVFNSAPAGLLSVRDDGYVDLPGRLSVGTTGFLGQMHVDQDSPTGGIPVLVLDQADESEEFLKFIGQTTDGDVTKSLVKVNDVGDSAIAGFLKIYVQDDDATDPIADGPFFVPFYTISGV